MPVGQVFGDGTLARISQSREAARGAGGLAGTAGGLRGGAGGTGGGAVGFGGGAEGLGGGAGPRTHPPQTSSLLQFLHPERLNGRREKTIVYFSCYWPET